MEVAAVLHPGISHKDLLTHEEIIDALGKIRSAMTANGYQSQDDKETRTPLDQSRRRMDNAQLLMMMTDRSQDSSKDEIGVYLNRKQAGLNALEFWGLQNDLPFLTRVAHDVLGIIPSSAVTERTFSCSGRIASIKRLRLSDEALDDSVMLQMNPRDLITEEDITQALSAATGK